MVRHSAAHPGAEEQLFARAAATATGVLGFSATSYARLLAPNASGVEAPSAAECYRYTLSQGASACISAPRGARELYANLDVLEAPALDERRVERLRAHGRVVREESLDFGRHIRRFPAMPEALAGDAIEVLDRELEAAPPER
jgi:hypothetical protein